ncbi:uncharacterized protein BDV14DRAFT_83993 [Aspergillus stella-maris]|uniref:uncharacterized protein n=1 Tax=Aspergillus stella-maris TaxID=1810926 RepID=UPI003CCE4964
MQSADRVYFPSCRTKRRVQSTAESKETILVERNHSGIKRPTFQDMETGPAYGTIFSSGWPFLYVFVFLALARTSCQPQRRSDRDGRLTWYFLHLHFAIRLGLGIMKMIYLGLPNLPMMFSKVNSADFNQRRSACSHSVIQASLHI